MYMQEFVLEAYWITGETDVNLNLTESTAPVSNIYHLIYDADDGDDLSNPDGDDMICLIMLITGAYFI